MKFSIALLGLAAVQVTSKAVRSDLAANEADCGKLGVMEWNLDELPKDTHRDTLRKCEKHPTELGIKSPLYNATEEAKQPDSSPVIKDVGIFSRQGPICNYNKGRGSGSDYDYGCTDGWCWRNCNGPFHFQATKKPWCWLAYDGGKKGWTPCGRWQDCEWSYNNKNSRCAKGNCKSCGCGC